MNYDFATYLTQQFQPTEQTIKRRIQIETQKLSRTRAESEKKRIIAEELISFVNVVAAGDMRLMDTIMSIFQMKYPYYKEGIRQAWQDNATKSMIDSTKMDLFFDISATEKRLNKMMPKLPRFSWYISLPVRMSKPFTSKDDREMHVLDNPICREWILGMPMIRPSTWKGNLRWTARIKSLDQDVLERLFGNESNEKVFHRGRLSFFPTFFDHINFEVITPLNRETRTPKTGPILMECVHHHPDDNLTAGEFNLLYLAPISSRSKEDEVIRHVAVDLIHTTEILTEMLLSYGFSAKKTSGFGVVEDNFCNKCGQKLGVLALTDVPFNEVESIESEGDLSKYKIECKSFGNCAEMCQHAKQMAKALEVSCP